MAARRLTCCGHRHHRRLPAVKSQRGVGRSQPGAHEQDKHEAGDERELQFRCGQRGAYRGDYAEVRVVPLDQERNDGQFHGDFTGNASSHGHGAVPIDDFTRETIDRLVGWIRASQAEEDFVYREAELDDLWRIIKTTAENARADQLPGTEAEYLLGLLALVRRAHDLVGHGHPDADPALAAQLLSSVR